MLNGDVRIKNRNQKILKYHDSPIPASPLREKLARRFDTRRRVATHTSSSSMSKALSWRCTIYLRKSVGLRHRRKRVDNAILARLNNWRRHYGLRVRCGRFAAVSHSVASERMNDRRSRLMVAIGLGCMHHRLLWGRKLRDAHWDRWKVSLAWRGVLGRHGHRERHGRRRRWWVERRLHGREHLRAGLHPVLLRNG